MKKSVLFFTLQFLFVLNFYSAVVTKSVSLGTVSIDGGSTVLTGVTFTSGVDFPASHLIAKVVVTTTFLKTDGSCGSPIPSGYSFNNEIYFNMLKSGVTTSFFAGGTWTGGTYTGTVSTIMDPTAGTTPTGTPYSGTFLVAGLSSFTGQSPFGTWNLVAGDAAGSDPLCMYSYSIQITTYDPLPIELLYFLTETNEEQKKVDINWSTATETNNEYFTIEKSKDGVDWENLTKVAGAGNSFVKQNYSTEDLYPYFGVSYYRLTQTDYNGDSRTYPAESVIFRVANLLFKHSDAELVIVGEYDKLYVYNSIGQLISPIDSSPNRSIFNKPITGVYLVKYEFRGKTKEEKIFIP